MTMAPPPAAAGSVIHLAVFIFGIIAATLSYLFLRVGSNFLIDRYYVTYENQSSRRAGYLESFQRWAAENKMSSEDTEMLAEWAKEHPYVYMLIYKDDQLFFSSDMSEGGEDGSDGSADSDSADKDSPINTIAPLLGYLGFSSIDEFKESREELIKEAEDNGFYRIELTDGEVFAAVTEFTEELYYDVINVAAFVMASLVLMAVLVAYMRRIISKIKRLETDVTIVSHYDMNHKIVCEGEDELGRLSKNVENMRNSLIENIKRERDAMSANTDLVTSVSHDLRTPLTVLLGYIDMMKLRVADDDEVMKNYILASENTAMRLKSLSDGMFRYALAFGNNEERVELEDYDAPTLLEQLFSEHILLLREEGFSVVDLMFDKIVSYGEILRTDAQCLMRMIDNIFSNVRKYADAEKPVTVLLKRDGDTLKITVRNVIAKVPNVAESNGIGLKTCARLAELVGARFNTEKHGDFFEATLKLKISEAKK